MNRCRCTLHTFTDLSSEAVTSRCPSAEKLTLRTVAVCALNTVDSPLLKDNSDQVSDGPGVETAQREKSGARLTYMLGVHNLTVLSLEPDATSSPEGEKCTEVTMS